MVLHEQNGRVITVAFDPIDLDKVAILDDENRLIAWAKPEHYATQSAESGPAISDSMRERRRLEKQTSGRILGIEAAARADGAMTEVEHLAWRAGVLDVPDVATQRRPRLRPNNTATAHKTADEIATEALAIIKKGTAHARRETREDHIDDVVTQRRARLRPDNTAAAPLTAAEIARLFEEA